MKIYNQEIKDGLKDAITENSIAYTSNIVMMDKPVGNLNIDIPKAVAQSTDWDLFPFYSILASIGWNENDDVFTKEETWAAKDTPVHKKVNYQHDEKEIIGVITSSLIIDQAGNIIQDNPPDQFDIAVSASLYRKWEDPNLQERMDSIIEGIRNNEWYVSMECLFPDFDYASIKDGVHSVIPRNEKTSFLTKYLRIYGGKGEYNGHKIGRLLKNFTFSGKGLVKRPANKRSVIFNFKSKAEINMENVEDLKAELAEKKTLLVKAEAKSEKLQEELMSKVQAAAKAEQEKLEKLIEKQNLSVAEANEELAKIKTALAEKEVSYENLEKTLKSTKDELSKAQSELEKTKSEKKLSERLSQLVKARVANPEEILSAWSSVSDEQFNQIVDLAKSSKVEAKDEDKEPDLSKAEVEEDLIPKTDPSKVLAESAKAATKFFSELFKEKIKE